MAELRWNEMKEPQWNPGPHRAGHVPSWGTGMATVPGWPEMVKLDHISVLLGIPGPSTLPNLCFFFLIYFLVGAWGQDDNDNPSGTDPQIPTYQQYGVSISGDSVELTCPEEADDELIKWEKNGKDLPNESGKQLRLEEFSEVENGASYACYTDSSKEKSYLYLRARVCKNCVEVDLTTTVAIIVADVCVTLGLLLGVYHWSRNRKTKSTPVTRGAGGGGRPRGQKKERPPPVPNPDYEPIRKGHQDLYSGLNQRGT
ncbi:T-cell surface glycoprotein CD3 epsilon chain isoform X2 [Suricata suricatta]|uniref:T-cell surface glycoprotein CD3 epsilon chain isoform X2 n=1 Tax=Suricata suricatta TaxID=37032 RepID=UPI0011564863|nr:T-cell surface glycoprotein CD3 epsilon chain isoform X2 [Suricata suricatta]